MKTFVAIYMGTQDALKRGLWTELDEDARKARIAKGMQAWMDWGKTHAAAIVDQGSPLGKTKRISPEGVDDIKNSMTGYVIVRAESHAAAAKMFESHANSRAVTAFYCRAFNRRSGSSLGTSAFGARRAKPRPISDNDLRNSPKFH